MRQIITINDLWPGDHLFTEQPEDANEFERPGNLQMSRGAHVEIVSGICRQFALVLHHRKITGSLKLVALDQFPMVGDVVCAFLKPLLWGRNYVWGLHIVIRSLGLYRAFHFDQKASCSKFESFEISSIIRTHSVKFSLMSKEG